MGIAIHTVTFLGSATPHPQAPPSRIEGNLEAEPAALIFRPFDRNQPPVVMLWWGFKRCQAGMISPEGLEAVLWSVASPLTLLTLGLWSGDKAVVWVEYWDEDYALTDTVYFQVGGLHHLPQAQKLASDIWDWRAYYYREIRDGAWIKRKD